MALTISILTLLALIYQLYLQRIHNENSLKPLGQISLTDSKGEISVRITNAGTGPLIIDTLTFVRAGTEYAQISSCLSFNPQSYMHTIVDDVVKKVLLPDGEMMVFAKNVAALTTEEIDAIRSELATILVRLKYRDIYKNRFSIERSLEWLSRCHVDKIDGFKA